MKPVTRRELDALLSFPRQYMRERLPIVHDCSHATNFEQGASECRECEATFECRWLYDNDECSTLGNAPPGRVVAALRTVLNQALVDVSRHELSCTCYVCSWLGRATELVNRVETCGLESEIDAAPVVP